MTDTAFSISVVLPTYNRLNRLKKILPSFLDTAVRDVQFIIVDNNSQDGTWDYLRQLKKTDRRIEIYRNCQNVGGTKTIFRGYCEVKSPYAIFLADDDLMIGDYIKRCLEIFESHDDVSMIHHFFDGWQKMPDRYQNAYIVHPSGNSAVERIFMYAGTYPGLALRMSTFSLRDFPLGDGVIYPQVKIAVELAAKRPIAIIKDCGLVRADFGDTVVTNKKIQNRPDDMGINERLRYGLGLKDPLLTQALALQLSGWANGLLVQFEREDERLARAFVRSLSSSLNVITPIFIVHLFKSRNYRYALTSALRLTFSPSFLINYTWFLLFAFKKVAKRNMVKRSMLE